MYQSNKTVQVNLEVHADKLYEHVMEWNVNTQTNKLEVQVWSMKTVVYYKPYSIEAVPESMSLDNTIYHRTVEPQDEWAGSKVEVPL